MRIVINDILTNYLILGDSSKTILILPGWKRSINEWIQIAKSFSKEYTVILLDLPGFGGTMKPKEVFGIYEYADFVEKFLSKLKIEKTILMGHSFGGRVGIVLAANSSILEKLILIDSAGIEKKSLFAKLTLTIKKLFNPIFFFSPEPVKNKIKNVIGSFDYKTSGEMHKIFVKIINQDLIGLLPKIKIPTFILWGDKDNLLPVSQTKIFKERIKNSKVRIVWGAGHDPHLQKPEQLSSILGDIL